MCWSRANETATNPTGRRLHCHHRCRRLDYQHGHVLCQISNSSNNTPFCFCLYKTKQKMKTQIIAQKRGTKPGRNANNNNNPLNVRRSSPPPPPPPSHNTTHPSYCIILFQQTNKTKRQLNIIARVSEQVVGRTTTATTTTNPAAGGPHLHHRH